MLHGISLEVLTDDMDIKRKFFHIPTNRNEVFANLNSHLKILKLNRTASNITTDFK